MSKNVSINKYLKNWLTLALFNYLISFLSMYVAKRYCYTFHIKIHGSSEFTNQLQKLELLRDKLGNLTQNLENKPLFEVKKMPCRTYKSLVMANRLFSARSVKIAFFGNNKFVSHVYDYLTGEGGVDLLANLKTVRDKVNDTLTSLDGKKYYSSSIDLFTDAKKITDIFFVLYVMNILNSCPLIALQYAFKVQIFDMFIGYFQRIKYLVYLNTGFLLAFNIFGIISLAFVPTIASLSFKSIDKYIHANVHLMLGWYLLMISYCTVILATILMLLKLSKRDPKPYVTQTVRQHCNCRAIKLPNDIHQRQFRYHKEISSKSSVLSKIIDKIDQLPIIKYICLSCVTIISFLLVIFIRWFEVEIQISQDLTDKITETRNSIKSFLDSNNQNGKVCETDVQVYNFILEPVYRKICDEIRNYTVMMNLNDNGTVVVNFFDENGKFIATKLDKNTIKNQFLAQNQDFAIFELNISKIQEHTMDFKQFNSSQILYAVLAKMDSNIISPHFNSNIMSENVANHFAQDSYWGFITDKHPTKELSNFSSTDPNSYKSESLFVTMNEDQTMEAYFIWNDYHYNLQTASNHDDRYTLTRLAKKDNNNEFKPYPWNLETFASHLNRKIKKQNKPVEHVIEGIFYVDDSLIWKIPNIYWIYIASDVNSMYSNNPSMTIPMRFVLKGIIATQNNTFFPGDIYRSLYEFADYWDTLVPKPSDMAYIISNFPVTQAAAGLGFIGTICGTRGVSAVRYVGLDSGYAFAHELGHNLGCLDEPINSCGQESGMMVRALYRNREWSTCCVGNITDRINKLKLANSYCLGPPAQPSRHNILKYPGLTVFNEQCQSLMNDSTAVIANIANCSNIICQVRGQITTFFKTPLDGTRCENINGKTALRKYGDGVCNLDSCITPDFNITTTLPTVIPNNCVGLYKEFSVASGVCANNSQNCGNQTVTKCPIYDTYDNWKGIYHHFNTIECRKHLNSSKYPNVQALYGSDNMTKHNHDNPCKLWCSWWKNGMKYVFSPDNTSYIDGTPLNEKSLCYRHRAAYFL